VLLQFAAATGPDQVSHGGLKSPLTRENSGAKGTRTPNPLLAKASDLASLGTVGIRGRTLGVDE
jgi:hypothetical protein